MAWSESEDTRPNGQNRACCVRYHFVDNGSRRMGRSFGIAAGFSHAQHNQIGLAVFRCLQDCFGILSVYRTLADARLWVITEADRSVTTILLPQEY